MNRKDLPEPNAICQVCGHGYRICSTCNEMKKRGIEAWRQHCDSYECAMVYYLITDRYESIDRERYNNVISVELPDDRTFTREVQTKLDGIEHYLSELDKKDKKKREDGKEEKGNQEF